MMKGVEERIDKGVLWWFSHIERMESVLVVVQWVGCGRDGFEGLFKEERFECQSSTQNGAKYECMTGACEE